MRHHTYSNGKSTLIFQDKDGYTIQLVEKTGSLSLNIDNEQGVVTFSKSDVADLARILQYYNDNGKLPES